MLLFTKDKFTKPWIFYMLIFQPTFCDLENIASKTIDILHDSHFLMLKIYEVLILNLSQNCRTEISFYSYRNYT